MVKQIPILMQSDMVRAILNGSKTETRRPIDRLNGFGRITEFHVSTTGGYDWEFRDERMLWNSISNSRLFESCPWGVPNAAELYVREKWSNPIDTAPDVYLYYADYPDCVPAGYENVPRIGDVEWKPSIHMPKPARRIHLPIEEIEVRRLQDMSEQDALAEGFTSTAVLNEAKDDYTGLYASDQFPDAWDSIYESKGYGWDKNPYVWVIRWGKAVIK